MSRRLLPLVSVVALLTAACSQVAAPEVEFGSGLRFVPMVADPLNDAGLHPSVVVDAGGRPVVGYFGFEEEVEEGELPATRPVGSPSLPGVLMTTVNEEGFFTRGAVAIEQQIPNVTIPFNPAFDPSVGRLAADTVTGLQVVADGERFHAAWAGRAGLFHATGSLDPESTEQVQISKVSGATPSGLSIGTDGSGGPALAFYGGPSPGSPGVQVATQNGGGWSIETVADVAGCDGCRTSVVSRDGTTAIAYSAGGSGVVVATRDGDGPWQSAEVAASGGAGLAAAAAPDGLALSFYDGGDVVLATGAPGGAFETSVVSEAAEGSATADGASTSVAVAGDGTTYVAWQDAEAGVRFATIGQDGFSPIATAPDTEGGRMPSVAVTEDGGSAYLAWYDATNQDLLLGTYGEVEGLAVADRSPVPTGPPENVVAPQGEPCSEVVNGSVSVQASGIAFDTPCLDVPAGEPFTIEFGNQDEGVQHNIAIYPSAEDLTSPLFQGEIFPGTDSREYQVDALEEGEYYFHCDVHPNMNGAVNAGADGGGGATGATSATGATGGGGGGGGALTVTAQNVAFDTSTIEVPAGEEATITFDNQDAGVQHNIAIYADDTLSESLFVGEIITGPDTIDYPIPPLEAGEYYFHCDVHPNMNGSVIVS